MADDNTERRRDGNGLAKFADSALLKVATAFLTLIMVPLVWRIADMLSDLNTKSAIMELRVGKLEALVPGSQAVHQQQHDDIQDLKYRITTLETKRP